MLNSFLFILLPEFKLQLWHFTLLKVFDKVIGDDVGSVIQFSAEAAGDSLLLHFQGNQLSWQNHKGKRRDAVLLLYRVNNQFINTFWLNFQETLFLNSITMCHECTSAFGWLTERR